MIRKLSLAVAVATALSPMGAWALGLGEIHPHSALNQNFNAEIDLLSVSQEELQDLRVSLASQEAFDRAGIERLFLLSGLKFTPLLAASGKPVISVTSSDPIREPFLNFLLEVNWPKGRLVREFTVLLDPPVTLNRTPQGVAAPRTSGVTSRQAPPAAGRRAMPATGSVSAAGAREYGPVQPNDNLWSIASLLRADGESVEQVMMALQRHNPDAFIDDNVNNLKVGKVLRLPEGADVASLSRQQAREEFLAQTRVWKSRRGMAASAGGAPAAGAEEKRQDRLKLLAPKPGGKEAMTREGKSEAEAEISRLEQEVLLVRESNASTLQENETLRNRVGELEKQIENIQRLMTLKSDQLSQMQAAQQIASQEMEQAAETPSAEQPAVTPEAPVAPVTEEVPGMEPETAAQAPIPGEVAQVPPLPPEETAMEEAPPAEPAPEVAPPQPQEPPVPVEPPPAVAEKPAVPEPEPEPVEPPAKKVGLLDSVKENGTLLGIVGGAALLLIAVLWFLTRRRKEAEAEFAESILVSPDSAVVAAGKDEVDSLNEPTDETSFMSDFSPSDIDALQDETGEVDPLSEADVYIAYGRYQQAEELIKQAIEKFPERPELKHKLLEIYFSAKKSKEFTKLAEELHGQGLEGGNPGAWSKITSMGKELNPSHALFAGATGGMLAGDEDLEDLGLDLGPEFTQTTTDVRETDLASDEIDSMDLSGLENLDELDSESLSTDLALDSEFLNKMESGTVEEEGGLDIDLSDLGGTAGQKAAPQAEAEPFDLSEVEQAGAIDLEDSEGLDNLDLESIERELEGLSGNLDTQTEEGALELPEVGGEELSLDLDSTDEVTTKLDLARAYIDMGDNEGAKSILEEVVSEGSDQQKREANELLGNIGA